MTTALQDEIDKMEFTSKNSFLTVNGNGKKEITSVKIDMEQLEKEDIEMLEDMIMVAVNDALGQIDKETEEKLGKYTGYLPSFRLAVRIMN